jgi:hypothetical protein
MIKHITVLVLALLLCSCAGLKPEIGDVTEEYLLANQVQIGYCEYQGTDTATGNRMVLYLRNRGTRPARLILKFNDGTIYGDKRETHQRFEITRVPEAFVQTWDWESYQRGDIGMQRAVNIQDRRIPITLLEQIRGKGDFPHVVKEGAKPSAAPLPCAPERPLDGERSRSPNRD